MVQGQPVSLLSLSTSKTSFCQAASLTALPLHTKDHPLSGSHGLRAAPRAAGWARGAQLLRACIAAWQSKGKPRHNGEKANTQCKRAQLSAKMHVHARAQTCSHTQHMHPLHPALLALQLPPVARLSLSLTPNMLSYCPLVMACCAIYHARAAHRDTAVAQHKR